MDLNGKKSDFRVQDIFNITLFAEKGGSHD